MRIRGHLEPLHHTKSLRFRLDKTDKRVANWALVSQSNLNLPLPIAGPYSSIENSVEPGGSWSGSEQEP